MPCAVSLCQQRAGVVATLWSQPIRAQYLDDLDQWEVSTLVRGQTLLFAVSYNRFFPCIAALMYLCQKDTEKGKICPFYIVSVCFHGLRELDTSGNPLGVWRRVFLGTKISSFLSLTSGRILAQHPSLFPLKSWAQRWVFLLAWKKSWHHIRKTYITLFQLHLFLTKYIMQAMITEKYR